MCAEERVGTWDKIVSEEAEPAYERIVFAKVCECVSVHVLSCMLVHRYKGQIHS